MKLEIIMILYTLITPDSCSIEYLMIINMSLHFPTKIILLWIFRIVSLRQTITKTQS